jgi:hypothetical protein
MSFVPDVRIPPAGDPIYAAGKRTGSIRHHRVDADFLELLEEDFGISQFALRSAVMGVPPASKRQAVALCELATWVAEGDPEQAGDALRAWAKKHQAGTYDPRLVDAPPLNQTGPGHTGAPALTLARIAAKPRSHAVCPLGPGWGASSS